MAIAVYRDHMALKAMTVDSMTPHKGTTLAVNTSVLSVPRPSLH